MTPETCPKCGSNFKEVEQMSDGNDFHHFRVVGIYDNRVDAVVAWYCPTCKHQWNREGEQTHED